MVSTDTSEYTMEFLRADTLNRDEAYQRSLEERRVKKIAEDFDWGKFRPISVGRRSDGTYWIIDGQHRWAAAQQAHSDGVELPCWVKHGTTPAEEAAAFLAINNGQKGVKPGARVRAGVACGDKAAVAVARILDEFEIHKNYDGGTGPFLDYNMSSWSGPMKVYKDGGEIALRRAIALAADLWGFGKDALCEYSLVGSWLFLKSYGDSPNFDGLQSVVRITRFTFDEVKFFYAASVGKGGKRKQVAGVKDRNAAWAESLRIAHDRGFAPSDRLA